MRHFSLVEKPTDWLNEMATRHHYMHRPIHFRACPFGWAVAFDEQIFQLDGRPTGFIVFASIHFTKLRGEFGYPGLPTKWQVLSLSRLWLHPDFQVGGRYFTSALLPGFTDRKGVFRSTLATQIIEIALQLVQWRWLEVHPPRFPNEPYHILKIISYANTHYFRGSIYRAAKFRDTGLIKSQKRHKNSRGVDIGNDELRRFIYDLDEPEWNYNPLQPKLI